MAYRQLFAVACAVLGLTAVPACGSGPGRATAVEADDTAPENEDAPPFSDSEDRAPSNADQPPSATDRPPSNPDQPPGGSAASGDDNGNSSAGETACEALCSDIPDPSECANGGLEGTVASICRTNCVLSEQQKLCDAQIARAIDCLAQLGEYCTGNPPEPAAATQCTDEFQALDTCEQLNDPDSDPPPAPMSSCTPADGCQCATNCQMCQCVGGTAQECAQVCM